MFKIPVSIPDGTHVASLAGVSEEDAAWGRRRNWDWLVEVEINGQTEIIPFTQLTSTNNGSQAMSGKILAALLGRSLQPGESVEAQTGVRVLLTFGKNDKGYARVVDVIPYVDPAKSPEGLPR